MNYTIKVTEDFIEQREIRLPLYNKNPKPEDMTPAQMKAALMRIDCEIYEWYMIKTGKWQDTAGWEIDGICKENGNVDVKFIEKWFNIDNKKMVNILKQRGIIDQYRFMEWVRNPGRPLVAGDEVVVADVRVIPYYQLLNNIQASRNGGKGFYVDVREITRNLAD